MTGRRAPAWRYVVPNAITAISLVMGVLAIEAAVSGRTVEAAWWGLYCTLTDKLDGIAARMLHATSDFGVQLDSLADLLSFGIVPPTVMYAFYSERPALGWASGSGRIALGVLTSAWVVAAAARLARFNVAATHESAPRDYAGTPSTMTAGIVVSLFLACLKYSEPAWIAPERLDRFHILGPLRLDALLPYAPLLLPAGAIGMVSNLRVPRLARSSHPIGDLAMLGLVLFGYLVGLFHLLPEYLGAGGIAFVLVSVVHHLRQSRV